MRLLWPLWVALCLLFASPLQAQDKTLLIKEEPVAAAQSFKKSTLVIGVSDYRNHAPLPACQADAT